jgi:hypothetical protein
MNNALLKLIEIGSNRLLEKDCSISEDLFCVNELLIGELVSLLKSKNGFYAFEAALHIFPSESTETEIGLKEWNKDNLWISDYRGMVTDAVFFAEDVFGGQFCIRNDGIYTFDPEVAEFEYFAKNLEQWAKELLANYNFLTGYPLAHEWQKKHGALPPRKRLIPKIPLVMQGDFSIENLVAIDSIKGMKWRADIAVQIANLADGDSITLRVID